MSKPDSIRLYFDIDGVYNAHTPPFPAVAHVPDREKTQWLGEWSNDGLPTTFFEAVPSDFGDTFHICWSRELIAGINELTKHEHVEFVWATTWRERAKVFAEKVGLEAADWRYLDATWDRVTDPAKEWWKFQAVKQDLIENPVDRFIWVDDEFPIRPEAVAWVESRSDGFAVSPAPELGITLELFSLMKEAVIR